jgi:glucose-1-phosphate cytidylyltransferase
MPIDKDTPVIILCGGQGTRIADVSGNTIPKPMVRIGDKPILWHIMKIYASQGYSNFILALGHLGWAIKDYFLNEHLMDSDFRLVRSAGAMEIELLSNPGETHWNIVFAETGLATQTGMRLALCGKYVESDYFMATYGDGVADIDIGALVRFAEERDRIGTVTSVTPASRFGNIETDGDIVSGFAEKTNAGGGAINGGFFVFKREFLDIAAKYGDVMLEREPLEELTAKGELAAYRHSGFWEPMDTMREYKLLNEMWDRGEAAWRSW